MVDSIFANPVVTVIVIIGIVVGLTIFVMKKFKESKPKPKKPQDFSKTIQKDLKEDIDQNGIKIRNGHLMIGYHKISNRLDKYRIAKGKFSFAQYDNKEKEMTTADEKEDVEYDLLLIRAKNPKILYRILGMRKVYFILKYTDGKSKWINFDEQKNAFFLPQNMNIWRYGGVWINSSEGIEFVNDISMKRMIEETMMYVEYLPYKIAHLDENEMKVERSAKTLTEIEKRRWEDRKNTGDSTIQ